MLAMVAMAATGAHVAARGADRLSRPRAIHRIDHSSSIVGLRDYLTTLLGVATASREASPTYATDLTCRSSGHSSS
jgi:hypothetical protein